MKDLFLLMDLQRTIEAGTICYYRQNRYEVTYSTVFAGIFERELAEEICKHDLHHNIVKIPLQILKQAQRNGMKILDE